jgi:hypothetical protein
MDNSSFVSFIFKFTFLNSAKVVSSVLVTVPDFGEGIKPLGPRTPSLANFGIIFGVAINKSKSMFP